MRPRGFATFMQISPFMVPMKLFRKKGKDDEPKTKCDTCGTELHSSDRLKRHMKKAHGNIPEKKLDSNSADGGIW